VAIDTEEDKGARQERIREFVITDVGKSGVGHEDERVIAVGNRLGSLAHRSPHLLDTTITYTLLQ
jgi:hypothetical protein